MPTLHLTTFIAAPAERVFDLSRSIDLHRESMSRYKEEAVSGVRFGLIEKEETVTWKARHFLKNRLLRVKITEMKKKEMFTDEQIEGDFKALRHEHYFKPCENGTIMIDILHFEAPYGLIGRMLNAVYLAKYMRRLLEQRNKVIKDYAEGEDWRQLLQKG